jgi:hypothetical protein
MESRGTHIKLYVFSSHVKKVRVSRLRIVALGTSLWKASPSFKLRRSGSCGGQETTPDKTPRQAMVRSGGKKVIIS